jgi:hypothetical protein
MIKFIIRIAIALFLFHFGYAAYLVAKCNFELMKDKIKEVEEGFIYVKSHNIEYNGRKDNEKNIYKLLLTSGKIYKISVYDENKPGEKMIVTLYDQNDKELFSNYVPQTKSYYSSILYDCKQSGIYYIGFHFQEGVSGCGIASLSFKKKHL